MKSFCVANSRWPSACFPNLKRVVSSAVTWPALLLPLWSELSNVGLRVMPMVSVSDVVRFSGLTRRKIRTPNKRETATMSKAIFVTKYSVAAPSKVTGCTYAVWNPQSQPVVRVNQVLIRVHAGAVFHASKVEQKHAGGDVSSGLLDPFNDVIPNE